MAKKEVKKENSKNKKSFFKDFKAELKKVNWPTPKQLLNNTVAVITIVFITAVIVFVLDIVFETINKYGLEKIKEVIVTDNTTADQTTEENAENETNTEENAPEENTEASNEENNTENEEEQ